MALRPPPPLNARHSTAATVFHLHPPQHHLIPRPGSSSSSTQTLSAAPNAAASIRKRPTFDGLDKRKSWSVEINTKAGTVHGHFNPKPKLTLSGEASEKPAVESPAPSKTSSSAVGNAAAAAAEPKSSRVNGLVDKFDKRPTGGKTNIDNGHPLVATAYQNSKGLLPKVVTGRESSKRLDFKKRKPIPLPRSKLPAPAEGKLENLPKPTQRISVTSKLFWRRSKTDLGAESLAAYKNGKRAAAVLPAKGPAPQVPTFNRPLPQSTDDREVKDVVVAHVHLKYSSTAKAEASDAKNKPKPELKVKPTFSTFKQPNSCSQKKPQSEKPSLAKQKLTTECETGARLDEMIKSEPLQIRTEPLNANSGGGGGGGIGASEEVMSESADKSCSSSFDSMDDSLSIESPCTPHSQFTSLTPVRSPVSPTAVSPPSPTMAGITPSRKVLPEWDEYEDEVSGRKFYYNTLTKEKSWKPPRKSRGTPESNRPDQNAPIQNDSPNNIENEELTMEVPDGYEKRMDGETAFFTNIFTGVRWFSAKDDGGKVYFYEENGNHSCWSLPNVSRTIQDSVSTIKDGGDDADEDAVRSKPSDEVDDVAAKAKEEEIVRAENKVDNSAKKNLRPASPIEPRLTLPISSPNIQIGKVSIVVVKQGPLNKTKLLENGKKHRKNWTSCHLVLTDTFLLFFKDSKNFASLQTGGSNGKPDHCVDLKGAEVGWCNEKSRRNNVFEVSTLLGMTMLLQYDVLQVAAEWFEGIAEIISMLNQKTVQPTPSLAQMGSPADSEGMLSSFLDKPVEAHSLRKKSATNATKVNRTRSLKMKILGSTEDVRDNPEALPNAQQQQNKSNIREKLRKFFQRRPAMDDLFRRGIIKNEPVFGSTLRDLQATDLSDVPVFVKACISEIEKGERLKTDGVYRQSGNICTIQKIRLQVDQGNVGILETVEDVHVLTGALKLFFRELKEPLIPWEIVNKLLLAANHQSKKKKFQQMKSLLASMPSAHKSTLNFLLRHLVRVTEFKDKNRMQFSNLAIVFGPTLMWPPPTSVSFNLALDMMQQNIIVEAILVNLDQLF